MNQIVNVDSRWSMVNGRIAISYAKRTMIYGLLAMITLSAFAQQKVYLSGTGSDKTVNWEFFCTKGMNAGKWTTIPVPSNWELQGFGKYNYGFAKDTSRGKEQGLYRHRFTAPATWQGKVVKLVFEGSMTDTEVKINGKAAGPVHQGSYYAFKYDISKLLNYGGENLLEATVSKHSANESVNDAERRGDFWLFGGIFRPVYLEVLPQQHISRVQLDAKANGTFRANVFVANGKPGNQVSVQLYAKNGKKFGPAITATITRKDSVVRLNSKFTAPELWSSEAPNLYKAEVKLLAASKTIHTVPKKIGFRTIEVKQRDGIFVNGTKVKFKGVNRHSFWPNSGRTTSKTISIMDVNLMKDMNMNAVRMSHYPPDDHFLDVCDSLGLFVMDELAGWHGNYNTPTGAKLIAEMLAHDENHPSIVFWANGNEGGHNLELDPYFDSGDLQGRPVVHPWQLFRGLETQHYREYDYGIGSYNHGHDIVMPTEFLHGMWDGGHGAGLEDYWEAMWRDPLAAGGFLWDFSDEGVIRTDKNGIIDTDGNHGADGIVGPYREKEGSFFTAKEVWSPIYFEKRELTPAFDGNFHIENRFFFTNTSQCTFSAKLAKVTGPYSGNASSETPVAVSAPAIKPLGKGDLKVSLPKSWLNYDVLTITARDPFKREVFTWSWPVRKPDAISSTIVKRAGPGKVTLLERDSLYIVSVNSLKVTFSTATGMLKEVTNEHGIIPFNNGPVLQEGLNNFRTFSYRMEGDQLVITSLFDKKSSYNKLEWTIYPSGWVKMKVNYFPGSYFTTFVGVNFSFPETEMKAVKYMGSGPYRVWKNRMKGTQLGVWEKTYNNSATGEPPFTYPEFQGYHANLYWCRFITTGQPFTVVTENEDTFLRLFTPKVSDDPYKNLQPTFPSGDISFMQGISGIGTKTQKPETTGPMGAKNILYDYEKDPARAKELVLYFDFSGK